MESVISLDFGTPWFLHIIYFIKIRWGKYTFLFKMPELFSETAGAANISQK